MRIANVNFETWCRNHDDDHEVKWCRELYPWSVFANLRYGDSQIGIVQEIEARGIVYRATISEIFEGENGRLNYLILLKTSAQSKKSAWGNRSWDDLFHLVATQDGQFITLFTEKRDPSKSLLGAFLGSDFPRIEESRSRPLSALLFRSLVSYRAEEAFGPTTGEMSFEWIPNGVRALRPKKQFRPQPRILEMLWTDGRKRWVTSAWTEEKAHRYALYNASQCEDLYVIYSHSTFTKHHRCEYPKTHVLSLLALVQSNNNSKKSKFLPHARLLINHLRRDEIRNQSQQKPDELAQAIWDTAGTVEIYTSYLREAGAGLTLSLY